MFGDKPWSDPAGLGDTFDAQNPASPWVDYSTFLMFKPKTQNHIGSCRTVAITSRGQLLLDILLVAGVDVLWG